VHSAYLSIAVGFVLILSGLLLFLTSDPSDQGIFKVWKLELESSEPILLIAFGCILLIIPWLPQIIHRSKDSLVQETPEGEFGMSPHSRKIERGSQEVILSPAKARFLLPPNEDDWDVISAKEYQAMQDVSIWDVPLFSTGLQTFMPQVPGRGSVPPLSHYFLKHRRRFEITLNEDTTVDNLYYSGRMPQQEELFDRFLTAGVAMQFTQIRVAITHDPAQLLGLWHELDIEEPIPIKPDGSPDVEAALQQAQSSVLEQLRSEDDDDEAVNELFDALTRKDLPITKQLYHSASIRIYNQQDILDFDPMLKLVYGDEFSLWNFLTSLIYIDRDVNISKVENMKWDEMGTKVSFTLTTHLDNVQMGGDDTSLTIRRLFFITKDAQRFHLIRINLLSGPGIYAEPAYDGLRKVLGSYRVAVPQLTGSKLASD
jgi:hypothetical protein